MTSPSAYTDRATCPDGVRWCNGSPDLHDGDRPSHSSTYLIAPAGGDTAASHADLVRLAIEREVSPDGSGETRIWLSPTSLDPSLGLGQAEQLAHMILRLVAVARDSDPAPGEA